VLIKTNKLRKEFANGDSYRTVLNDVDFEVNEGDFVCITGASGSGKSTLLSIIGLLDNHTSGEYFLCEENINEISKEQKRLLRNTNLGWIFQNFNLINNLNVFENVTLPLRYNKHVNHEEYYERSLSALNEVGMSDRGGDFPSQLSGGQQQRVAIARAIVNQPDIILADEPTGNLDQQNSNRVIDILQTLNNKGTTILLVTHELEIAKLIPKSYSMQDGKLEASNLGRG
jgi:putative ABC transport system ATP-binding protein